MDGGVTLVAGKLKTFLQFIFNWVPLPVSDPTRRVASVVSGREQLVDADELIEVLCAVVGKEGAIWFLLRWGTELVTARPTKASEGDKLWVLLGEGT